MIVSNIDINSNEKKLPSHAVGKRKNAIARCYPVFNTTYSGKVKVNGKTLSEYFGRITLENKIIFPLVKINQEGKENLSFNCEVVGGGKTAQAEAICHGISKWLATRSIEERDILKKEGLLTRDSRIKLRKMVGCDGHRRTKQSPKR